eukprot:1597762-Alexandrium_andersonii.AAC.2
MLKASVWWEPFCWKGGRVCPVYRRKGPPTQKQSYRGVQVSDISGKILHGMYRQRLIKMGEDIIGSSQFGALFRRGTDVASAII